MFDLKKSNDRTCCDNTEAEMKQEQRAENEANEEKTHIFEFVCPHCNEESTGKGDDFGDLTTCALCDKPIWLHGKKSFSTDKLASSLNIVGNLLIFSLIPYFVTQVFVVLYFTSNNENLENYMVLFAVITFVATLIAWGYMAIRFSGINEACWSLIPKTFADAFSLYEHTESTLVLGITIDSKKSMVHLYHFENLKSPLLLMLGITAPAEKHETNSDLYSFFGLVLINAILFAVVLWLFCSDIIGLGLFIVLCVIGVGAMFLVMKSLKDDICGVGALAIAVSSMLPSKVVKRKIQ